MKEIGIEAYELDELDESFVNKYDNAFAFEVIEHVENQLIVLDSIYRYIKNNGYFLKKEQTYIENFIVRTHGVI